jgi:Zn-dependent peptidase ImmA (M78 family)
MTLEEVFGAASTGETYEQRAATSERVFVKSQFQLAIDSPRAKGRRLSALEALESYGIDFLKKVVADGGAGFITDGNEPAITISRRRKYLKLSKRALSLATGLDSQTITKAETAGLTSAIRDLETIAQILSLDERVLGVKPQARGDMELGARLREMNDAGDRDDQFIIAISEAAWVIRRQAELAKMLKATYEKVTLFGEKSSSYAYPAYKKGYDLAERSRVILGIDPFEPITSIYNLTEDQLGVPIVETDLGEGRAGATIVNATSRGIAISKRGANANVLVRRMTIAHELGHLLWDPDAQLGKVRVEGINAKETRDPVEVRANAFGIAFLAPPKAVEKIIKETVSFQDAVRKVVSYFGVSPSAAINHIANIDPTKSDMRNTSRHHPVDVINLWNKAENRPSLLESVVESRRGRFATLAIQAARKNLITVDTLSSWLKVDKRALHPFFSTD